MAPWKSSEGGTITKLGASSLHVEAAATTELISAAVNTKGITIRTAAFMVVGASGWGALRAGGIRVAVVYVGAITNLRELFVPAGVAVEVERQAGTIHVDLTYDIH